MPEHTIIDMNDYEKKLLQYRAKERQEERVKRWKNFFWSSVSFLPNLLKRRARNSKHEKVSQHPNLPTIRESSSSDSEWETDSASDGHEPFEHDTHKDYENSSTRGINWRRLLLHFIVWGGTFAYAVHIEFGTVYLLLSAFYFMWINTRTEPKKPNEISAYSVFNPNCERIQGTLDAETLEKEMKYGFII